MENPSGQYDQSRPWQLTSETLAAERTWHNNGPSWTPEITTVQPPMLWQDADEWIRAYDCPPVYGYRSTELGIDDILDGNYSRLSSQATPMDDWSGVNGGYQSTMRPTGAGGGGIS